MAMANSKAAEAKEHIKAAEKALKTGLLKWKADYDVAADEYSQAAQCYRIARDYRSCKDCHMRASDYYQRNKAFFHAAKALEKAVLVVKDIATPVEISALARESSSLYQQHGSCDSAAQILDKAGQILQERCPEQALMLFRLAAEVSQNDSGQHQAADYLSRTSRLLVKLGKFEQALDTLRLEMGLHVESGNTGAAGRLTLVMVLVQLARGDVVAAEKAYKEWGNYCEQAEMGTIEQLLCAYDEEDRTAAQRALASPFIRHMDVEYAKLAAAIKLPAAMNPAKPRQNATTSYASGSKTGEAGSESGSTTPPGRPPTSDGNSLC